MKRLCIILALFVLAVMVWAANTDRIKEIEARQQMIVVEINDRQNIIAEQNQAIEQRRQEFLKLQGAKEELQRQDAEAAKKESAK
jgi:Flp pilus assembly protein TadB